MYKCVTSLLEKPECKITSPPPRLPSPGVSPSPTTLLDRYSSPPTGMARRRLFVDPLDSESGVSTTSTAPATVTKTDQASIVTAIPAGQTVVTMTADNGQTVTIPVQGETKNTQLDVKYE